MRGAGAVVADDDPKVIGCPRHALPVPVTLRVSSGRATLAVRTLDALPLERGVHGVARRSGRLAGLRPERMRMRRLLPRPEPAHAPDQAVGGSAPASGPRLAARSRRAADPSPSPLPQRRLRRCAPRPRRVRRPDSMLSGIFWSISRSGCGAVPQGRPRTPGKSQRRPPPSRQRGSEALPSWAASQSGGRAPGARSNRSRRRRRFRAPNAVFRVKGALIAVRREETREVRTGLTRGSRGRMGKGGVWSLVSSFPSSAWERLPRNAVSRPVQGPDAKRSFADVRSRAELGNEGSRVSWARGFSRGRMGKGGVPIYWAISNVRIFAAGRLRLDVFLFDVPLPVGSDRLEELSHASAGLRPRLHRPSARFLTQPLTG